MAELVREHGEYVWVKPQNSSSEFAVLFGARVVRTEKTQTLISDDRNKQQWVPAGDVVKAMHLTSQGDVEDMITLGDLQEYTILRNLETRYNKQLIYTYTGSMLVAINPYQILPIYTHREIQLYRNRKLHELPPHIFAISDNAFQQLQRQKVNQCVVISGESGAGKTESTKLILQYLATISGKHSWIEQQIIEANPIMEAFGNAKTVRNDNSSRFGKYIDIRFTEQGVIQGAKIEQYLLEKSRIVFQSRDERNYHIFYCMLAGLSQPELQRLELMEQSPSKYHYLAQGGCLTLEGKDDAKDFADIRAAMKVLSFTPDELWNIFSLLAAILHLGNLRFKATEVANLEAAEVDDPLNLERVAKLLGINMSSLNLALTQRTIFVHGEHVVTSLSKEAALEGRDGFVKSLYDGIFVRIVRRINETINKEPGKPMNTIGVLDIFGFENFDNNSFEQLCINYANENLQQFFVKHIFKMEQAEYQNEDINWQHIDFQDNQEILDLIGMKPVNIMSLIDEESKFPKGTDQTLLEKLHVQHGKRSIYVKGKTTQTSLFGIRHYAGVVMYNPIGFLEKNRDSFTTDLRAIVRRSKNKYLVDIFPHELPMDTTKKQPTLSVKFRNSLELLMRTLSSAHPYFVRCIKPNEFKEPNNFDKELCVRQLRYSGMMETARIRRAGYPMRHTYREFVGRYRLLVRNVGALDKCDCGQVARQICKSTLPASSDRQFGRTKVFLRDADDALLEAERSRVILKSIVTIQCGFRRVLFRRYLQKYRTAIVTVQRYWRGRQARRKYQTMRQGFHRLGACIAAQLLTHKFTMVRTRMIKLQALSRGYLVRKRIRADLAAKREEEQRLARQREQEKQRHSLQLLAEQRQKEQLLREQQLREAAERNALAMAAVHQPKRTKSVKQSKPTLQAQRSLAPPAADGAASPLTTRPASAINGNAAAVETNGYMDDESSKQIVDDYFGFLNDEADAALKSISSNGTIRLPKPVQIDVDTTDYSFSKYVSTYFCGGATSDHVRKPLKQSLLKHDQPIDDVASQAIWLMILRFMGDMPEVDQDASNDAGNSVNLMQNLSQLLSKHDLRSADAMGTAQPQRFVRKTLKRKSKLPGILRQVCDSNKDEVKFYQQSLNTSSSHLDKLHFVIGHGILRPSLRDEILAQVCKQLNNNPSRSSLSRGWLLLSVCVGCFPPSATFENHLRCFLNTGPQLLAAHVLQRMERTLINGPRSQPPSLLELQAIKGRSPMKLDIHFMDGEVRRLQVDSASTAVEAVQQLATNVGLTDSFGFGLFITLYDKVMSLGSGREHVLDAISCCEQFAKERGEREMDAPWKLYFRKDMFASWYDPSLDAEATHLTYKQVMHGFHCGEYRCRSEKDIAMICALACYIEHGSSLSPEQLTSFVREHVPQDLLAPGERAVQNWSKLIAQTHARSDYVHQSNAQFRAKEDICLFAHLSWPMPFSRLFEAVRIAGPKLQSDNLVLAVNATGIYFIDDMEQVLASCSFAELQHISHHKSERSTIDELHVLTVQQENFVLKCYESRDVAELINFIIDNLKERSKYGVAKGEQNVEEPAGNEVRLQLKRGDLVEFETDVTGGQVLGGTQRWWRGRANGQIGEFSSSNVQVLATLSKPSQNIQEIFRENVQVSQEVQTTKKTAVRNNRPHNLARLAETHFREPSDSDQFPLWSHSANPLKAPLLKLLKFKPDLYQQALVIFHHILKYMGDIPRGSLPVNTDLIFQPALQDELLCDELYCCMIKQLTDNPLTESEERGWDLLYLASGIMTPSSLIMRELVLFLRQQVHILADMCLKRLKRTLANGRRKHAPHLIEVEGIQQRCMHIYHKIYFPDNTVEAFEIASYTHGAHLIDQIAERLELKSHLGFSIFVKVGEKVYAMPESDFVFDFITELMQWLQQQKSLRSPLYDGNYQLHFMRKLWLNNKPGTDTNADIIFNYPQELHKYLKGYYAIDCELASQLAALIYVAANGASLVAFQRLQELLISLLPEDLVPQLTVSEWRQQILHGLRAINVERTSDMEAKQMFLLQLSQQPFFGSTFFVVKQLNDETLPEYVLIAINSAGFHIVDIHTKLLLRSFEYHELGIWSSGKTHFHIRFGNMIGALKLLCNTTQGYKMDDLLSSYIKNYNEH